jgi:hypothetical protein
MNVVHFVNGLDVDMLMSTSYWKTPEYRWHIKGTNFMFETRAGAEAMYAHMGFSNPDLIAPLPVSKLRPKMTARRLSFFQLKELDRPKLFYHGPEDFMYRCLSVVFKNPILTLDKPYKPVLEYEVFYLVRMVDDTLEAYELEIFSHNNGG